MQRENQPASSQGRAKTRAVLIDELNHAAREASGLGILLGQTAAARLGVNSTDFECMDFIGSGDGITAGALAKATGLTTGAITGVIDRLEVAGLAERVRVPHDRRKVYVRMTTRARRFANQYDETFGREVNRITDAYSNAEIALIAGYFRKSAAVILAEIERLKGGRA